MLRATLLLALWVTACDAGDKGGLDSDPDADGDGVPVSEDCDDEDPARAPGLDERCDGLDNDCDGTVDEDAVDASTWYADADDDGAGDPDAPLSSCEAPEGAVSTGDDCDDTDPAAHPGAAEVCDPDDVDEDCDGLSDDLDDSTDPTTQTGWYPDADADGYGDEDGLTLACDAPASTTADGSDCDDADPDIHPGATEVCDPDDVDEDCDGLSDDADPTVDPATQTSWYPDADLDGFGDPDTAPVLSCESPGDGYAAEATDCDDGAPEVSPDAEELCDGTADEDCDAVVDEGCGGLSGDADTLEGFEDGAAFGWRLAGGEDYTGDGIDDVAVAALLHAEGSATGAGAVYVVSGPPSAWSGTADTEIAATYAGDLRDENAGTSLDLVADMDDDGYAELLVASQRTDYYEGGVALVYGPTDAATFGTADFSITSVNDYLGYHQSQSAGDWDGDGVPDLVVSAPFADVGETNGGCVCFFWGPVSDTTTVASADLALTGELTTYLGYRYTVDGDFDGDGSRDVASAASGTAYVWSNPGTTSADVDAAVATITGDWSGTSFGYNFGAGDLDGDGYDDLLVGASQDDTGARDAGRLWGFSGPISGASSTADSDFGVTHDTAYDGLGDGYHRLDLADLDGDGADDLGVGLPLFDGATYDRSEGLVALFYGPIDGVRDLEDNDQSWEGEGYAARLGQTVQLLDGDGDGAIDLLTGAHAQVGESTDEVVGRIYWVDNSRL